MQTCFLHSADWQLGKPFASLDDDAKRHRLQQERVHVIQRMAKIVEETDPSFVVVAGDVFDSPHVTKSIVSTACAAIGSLNSEKSSETGRPSSFATSASASATENGGSLS